MTIQAQVAALKQHLEQLFPGKLISGKENPKSLLTGLPKIDANLPRALARQRITEWIGQASSGKTTVLRTAIANWCASGFDVAYVDAECKLLAADWSSVDQGRGKFWVIRPEQPQAQATPSAASSATSKELVTKSTCDQSSTTAASSSSVDMLVGGAREPPGGVTQPAFRRSTSSDRNAEYYDTSFRNGVSRVVTSPRNTTQRARHATVSEQSPQPAPDNKKLQSRSNAYTYATDQLIRCNTFDVIILDLGNTNSLSSRIYARLQNSLARSKAALIILRDGPPAPAGWGCHTQLSFHWGDKPRCEAGLNGIAAIVPSIDLSIWRDGLSKSVEVAAGSHVSNRLFTHSPVPDRRAPKA